MDTGGRLRSNAFGEKNSPKLGRLRRYSSSRNIHGVRGQFQVEIPSSILRGNGIASYHVYEVKVRIARFHSGGVYLLQTYTVTICDTCR